MKSNKKHLPSSVEDKLWIEVLQHDFSNTEKTEKLKNKWVNRIVKHLTKK